MMPRCKHKFTPSWGNSTCMRCAYESLQMMLARHGVCPKCEGVYSKKPNVLRCMNEECKFQMIPHAQQIHRQDTGE